MTPARRFQFRLALALGIPNPDALLDFIPDRIYREWMTYAQWEPFGEERGDLRAGIVAATVANAAALIVNALTGKRRRPTFKPRDFIHDFKPPVIRSPDQLFEQVKAINQLFGGAFVDQRLH